MTPREEEARKRLIGQWLYKAQVDLEAADELLGSKRTLLYPACFHCQQTAEKYLKGLLTWHQVEFPKTHVIGDLLDLLATVDAPLSKSLADATALNPYGVEVRYPGDIPEPNATEAQKALELARTVRDAVMRALPPL
jgi:HEPN domain-containing protein